MMITYMRLFLSKL